MATKTHTISGFICWRQYSWQPREQAEVTFYPFKPDHDKDIAIIREHSFDVEVDENFDPTPQQVQALNEKKRLVRLKCAEDLMAIDEELGRLQAIGNEVQA